LSIDTNIYCDGVIPTERSDEGSQKYREIRDSSHSFRRVVEGFARKMTKQRFVIGEFISVTMNEPMLFCFVIGEFISVTMNEPMLFCFVIDEFCSNRSNVALPPLRQ